MVGDVLADSEAPVVTSSILRFVDPTRFFRGTYRGRVCIRVFIGVCMCAVYVSICISVDLIKKEKD
jgi:hypothetical protein